MKIVGAFFMFFAWVSLSDVFSWSALVQFIFGLFLVASQECLTFLSYTERFVHRSGSNVKK
jgi:hypothetical protein